ncbi:protein kinase [Stylonychia lemnae]|uniref:non-specific serine/threonine protein kinase n=1 Tax=Stylonychia lemnae TaxID=5949 RepID=A0A078BFA2_STYLE|nr:protein kinase [Stylonychia lemnae]|eukprot:CDW91817.1 protein kinase [Stylonychia lemnae]
MKGLEFDDLMDDDSLLMDQTPKITFIDQFDYPDDENLLKSPQMPSPDKLMDAPNEFKNEMQSTADAGGSGPSWDDYFIDKILGEGAYGKVFKVYKKGDQILLLNKGKHIKQLTYAFGSAAKNAPYQKTSLKDSKLINPVKQPIPYVIKELYTDLMPKNAALQAMEEISILGSLNSPYIVTYIDSFICDTKVNIIMEFCENGDLQTYLLKRQKEGLNSLPELVIWRFLLQICLGVNYLHGKNVLHRDLKSLNIFLCKENQLKIGDLGVAKKFQDITSPSRDSTPSFQNQQNQQQQSGFGNSKINEIEQTTKVGTPFYLAPEIWEGKPYTEKSDIWSLGVILYEMCTFLKPFQANTEDELREKVLKEKYKDTPEELIVSKELREIIKKLLRKNPIHRPTIKDILLFQSVRQKAKQLKFELPASQIMLKNLPNQTIVKSVPSSSLQTSNYGTMNNQKFMMKDSSMMIQSHPVSQMGLHKRVLDSERKRLMPTSSSSSINEKL